MTTWILTLRDWRFPKRYYLSICLKGLQSYRLTNFFIFQKLYKSFYVSYFHMKTAPPMNTFDFFTLNCSQVALFSYENMRYKMKNQGHLKFDLFGLTWFFQDKWVIKQSCTSKNTPHEVVFRPKLLPPRNSQNRSLCIGYWVMSTAFFKKSNLGSK